jgi:hypothetical protein
MLRWRETTDKSTKVCFVYTFFTFVEQQNILLYAHAKKNEKKTRGAESNWGCTLKTNTQKAPAYRNE